MIDARYTSGPINARLVLVGEAPGAQEVQAGEAFVGKAGNLLNELLRSARLSRSSCYIDNVFQFRPERNDVRPYLSISGRRVKESKEYVIARAALLSRLAQTTATTIVTLGNVPTYTLTGYTEVTKVRGSVLQCPELGNRKVIPCIHPSAALREFLFRYYIVSDLIRAREHTEFPETRRLERNLLLEPSYETALAYLEQCHKQESVAYDIEVRGQELSHLSIAVSPTDAICIPFVQGAEHYWGPEQETEIMRQIARLLENPRVIKIGQNLTFDATFLYDKYGIVSHPIEDTMVAQGILYPEFPKGLDFLTSIYCGGEPYYKDDGKEWFKNPFGSEQVFRRYNAMDSAVLMQIFPQQVTELTRQRNTVTYQAQRDLIYPLVYAGNKGIRMDTEGMKAAASKTKARIRELQAQLNELVGRPLNVNSSQQLQEYFYVEKKLRPYIRDGRVSVDVKALNKIAAKGFKEAQIILELRHEKKMLGTYYEMEMDEDGRMRCSFNPVGTVQGRISSSKTLRGTGGNLQNTPPLLHAHMLADPGHIVIKQDLGQAENRVVAYLWNVERMIVAFEQGLDIHKQTAALLHSVPIEQVDDEQRQDGKKANHGLNYDLKAPSFADVYQMPLDKAHWMVETYHRIYPEVREGHAATRYLLSQQGRTLENLFGRRRTFRGRWGEDLFKAAYSYVPQSTVADLMNRHGICAVYYRQDLFPEVSFSNTVHDSINYQVPCSVGIERIIDIILQVKGFLERSMTCHNRQFSIPVDTEIGFSFDKNQMLTWKAPHIQDTSREVLTEELSRYVQERRRLD